MSSRPPPPNVPPQNDNDGQCTLSHLAIPTDLPRDNRGYLRLSPVTQSIEEGPPLNGHSPPTLPGQQLPTHWPPWSASADQNAARRMIDFRNNLIRGAQEYAQSQPQPPRDRP